MLKSLLHLEICHLLGPRSTKGKIWLWRKAKLSIAESNWLHFFSNLDPRFSIEGKTQKIIDWESFSQYISANWDLGLRKGTCTLDGTCSNKKLFTHQVFLAENKSKILILKKIYKWSSSGRDTDGREANVKLEKWLCKRREIIRNWNVTLLRRITFSKQQRRPKTLKLGDLVQVYICLLRPWSLTPTITPAKIWVEHQAKNSCLR